MTTVFSIGDKDAFWLARQVTWDFSHNSQQWSTNWWLPTPSNPLPILSISYSLLSISFLMSHIHWRSAWSNDALAVYNTFEPIPSCKQWFIFSIICIEFLGSHFWTLWKCRLNAECRSAEHPLDVEGHRHSRNFRYPWQLSTQGLGQAMDIPHCTQFTSFQDPQLTHG